MRTLAPNVVTAAGSPLKPTVAAQFAERGRGFLNSASVGVPPACTLEALESVTASWASGSAQPAMFDAAVERSRASFARLTQVDATAVSVASQVAYFVGLIASSLPAGSEVVAYRGDFTSLLFPFMVSGKLRVRLVELDEIAAAIGPQTALVAVSSVQSACGSLADLEAIRAAAQAHGARTLIDTTQSTGWLPLDAAKYDFTVCGAYKWLLSPRGVAFMTSAEAARASIVATAASWYAGVDPWTSVYGPDMALAADARRFDLSPAWMCFSGAAPALELIEAIGVEAIEAHVVGLANRARRELGLEASGSAIVSLAAPGAAERLAAAGVSAAVRGGCVRVGFHLYNTEADVDALVAALA